MQIDTGTGSCEVQTVDIQTVQLYSISDKKFRNLAGIGKRGEECEESCGRSA
jgi:hypothetical protein